MANQTVKAAQEAVQKAEEFDIRYAFIGLNQLKCRLESWQFPPFLSELDQEGHWTDRHILDHGRRSPISIAAAVIYIITQLSDDKKPLKGKTSFLICRLPRFCTLFSMRFSDSLQTDVSLATGVAEGTIRNSYKDLYPYLSKMLPSWYAQEEDLKNLSSPWYVYFNQKDLFKLYLFFLFQFIYSHRVRYTMSCNFALQTNNIETEVVEQ